MLTFCKEFSRSESSADSLGLQIWRNQQICRPFVRILADLRNLLTFCKELSRSESSADSLSLQIWRNLQICRPFVRNFADLRALQMTHSVYRFGEELRSEDVRDFADLDRIFD